MNTYVASHLKDMNRQIVYNLIASLGTTSKADLSKRTGISAPTIIKVINYLISQNLVVEIGEGESAIGRKPQLLTLNRNFMYNATFLIEGDHLTMGVVNIVGEVIYRKSLSVEPDLDILLDRITNEFIEPLLKEAGIPMKKLAGIGIALPCIYDPVSRCVSSSPLIGVDTVLPIGDRLDQLAQKYNVQIQVENDVNAQVLGEYHMTDTPQSTDMIFISVGTGLGAGIILDGQLRYGPHNMCGEIGSFIFQNQESPATKGGWLESQISSRVLEERFHLSFDMDDRRTPADSDAALAAIDYLALPLALCINNIAALLDCRLIVLGGIIADTFGTRLTERVQKELHRLSRFEFTLKRPASPDVGLIGISSLITNKKISTLLTEQGG